MGKTNQDQKQGDHTNRNKHEFTAKYYEQAWNEFMSRLASTHRIDMVAGRESTNMTDRGNKNINGAIGSQWIEPKASSRRDELREYAHTMAGQGCPMPVQLSTCDRLEI